MRSINWLILGLLVLVITAASAVYSGLDSNNINIVVNTNGTATNVNYQNALWGTVSPNMQKEIKNKASEDIQSDTSTVDSIKADLKNIASKYNYNADIKIVSQFGTDQLPMRATVRGTSMVPTLQDGQDIVILKTKNLNIGDIVVAIHPTYGLIVKRLSIIEGNQVYLTSDNKNVEIINTKTKLSNGSVETVTVQKTPLNTWLPTNNVIGVVKVY
jgi:signal peptidase I